MGWILLHHFLRHPLSAQPLLQMVETKGAIVLPADNLAIKHQSIG